jgi:hypothetical protein
MNRVVRAVRELIVESILRWRDRDLYERDRVVRHYLEAHPDFEFPPQVDDTWPAKLAYVEWRMRQEQSE